MICLKKEYLLLLFLFFGFSVFSQDFYFINAPSGLNVRETPSLKGEKIAKIPYGVMVEKIEDTGIELSINDNGKILKGNWVKIRFYNYPYVIFEEIEYYEKTGYVFDGFLKRQINKSVIVQTNEIHKEEFETIKQTHKRAIKQAKIITDLDSIKAILKGRVDWVTEFEDEIYQRDDAIKSITINNGQKLMISDSNEYGFAEDCCTGFYPEYDILVFEGGHSSEMPFSIATGETETAGNPMYIEPSPKNTYRLNGSFGGQECVLYFFQKNVNGVFEYFVDFDWWAHGSCNIREFIWTNEAEFVYSSIYDYETPEKDRYFYGKIIETGTILKDPKTVAVTVLEYLKKEKTLIPLMADYWAFVYHEDNRVDGSTDGEKHSILDLAIDGTIKLNVKNDGIGWFEKKPSKAFELEFNLSEKVKTWDRFEIGSNNTANTNEKKFILYGGGESDYIEIYLNQNNRIYKIKYSSEDPG